MNRRALVIESDPNVRTEILEIVESLGHQAISCSNQKAALELIEHENLSYIIAGIQMRASDSGRSKNIDNCSHFIYQAQKALPKISIIVTGNKDLAAKGYAAKFIRAGAFDYVDLPAPSAGRSLSEATRDMLRQENKKLFDRRTVTLFESGDMVFYDDRVELCEIMVTEDDDLGLTKGFLELLAKQTITGRRHRYTNSKLVKLLNASSPEAIRTMICRVRRSIFVGMRKEKNINAGIDEIIKKKTGKGGGYYLSKKVNVVFKTSAEHQESDQSKNILLYNLSKRQQKIVDHLCRHGKISNAQIQKICNCSARTAQRELAFLRDNDYIVFVGHGARGRWEFSQNMRNKLCNLD